MAGGRYPPELREQAVRMVAEIGDEHGSEWAAISEVARLLGVGAAETVRKWGTCRRFSSPQPHSTAVPATRAGLWCRRCGFGRWSQPSWRAG
jgi:transposase